MSETVYLGIGYPRDLIRLQAQKESLNVLCGVLDSDSAYISFYYRLHDSDEWGCSGILIWKKIDSSLCTAMAERIALARIVVKIKHMLSFLFKLQYRHDHKTMINSSCVFGQYSGNSSSYWK